MFLQRPEAGSRYPRLDPGSDAQLDIYLYTGSRFGYSDAGSLSCLAKTKLTDLYDKHYPTCLHKLPKKNLLQVNADLKGSYVDDLISGSTIADVSQEEHSPSFCHDMNPPFSSRNFLQQSEILTMTRAAHIQTVLDFTGFNVKVMAIYLT